MLFLSITQTKLISSVEDNPLGIFVPPTGDFELKIVKTVIITFHGNRIEELKNKYIDWAAVNYHALTKDGIPLEEEYHSITVLPEGDISRVTLSVPLSDNILASSLMLAVEPLLSHASFQVSKKESDSGAIVKLSFSGNNNNVKTFIVDLKKKLEAWVNKHGIP